MTLIPWWHETGTKSFLGASFSGADRHRRRLAKVTQVEGDRIPSAVGGK